jgi:SAM-dependent methyltransferase
MSRADARYDRDHGAPRRELNVVLETFASTVPPDARVIEVGAGIYDHTRFFTADVDTFNNDPATRPAVLGDAHAMPIADATYDVCVCISTLEHVRDPYRVTREIHRILKPGGRVFAWVPFYFGVHDFPIDVSRFTREGCVVLFEAAGFEHVEADSGPWSGLFHNLHNTVHFVLPRASRRRRVRVANRVLLTVARLGFPLDRRLQLRTLYAGCAVEARKP